jgi:hypothetical protein
MIEVETKYVRPSVMAKRLNISWNAFYRHIHRGILDAQGVRVKVKAIKIGGVRMTTQEWVDEFLATLNTPEAGPVAPALASGRATTQRRPAREYL